MGVVRMALKDDVEEHLRLNDLSPGEASTASLAGSLGAHPAEVADVLDDLAADAPLATDDIREHYRRVREVYDGIAALDADQEARTGGVIDNSGWYASRSNADDFDSLEEGYDQLGSPNLLESAADKITREGGGRVLYALTTYSPVMDREEPFKWGEKADGSPTREWRTESPLPDYDEIVGQALFADVDVADEYKERPLPSEIRDVVEAALEVYVDRFADLAGSRDHVLLLDSVGGAYPMIPPSATAPLAEQFTASGDRQLVYEHLCSRMDEWLADVWSEVQESVSGAAEYLDPDHINNKNRQYKTALSVHKSIDGVVTPIDVDDVRYEHVPVREVGNEEIAASREWGDSLTADRHQEAIAPIIETLWPDYYADADTWVQALQEWLLDRESERIRKEQRRQERMEALQDGEVVELQTADVTLTTDQSDVQAALDALDPERVIEDTILGAGWTDRLSDTTDRSGDGRRAFVPTWAGTYKSGNATFVAVRGPKAGVWYDSSDGYEGGPVEAALIAHAGRTPAADDWASGEDWREGVDILRRLGYDIPVWIPDASSLDEDQMPLWALRKFALKLDIVEQHELVERTGDDGSSYLGFRPSDYRRAVRRAEAAGLETGRTDHIDDAPTSEYYDADLQAYTETEQSPYADPDVMLAACLRARADGAVSEDAEPPTLALIPIVRDAGKDENPGDMSPGTRAMAVDVFQEDIDTADVEEDDTVTIFD
jgi:putative DNA primase/helicase